VSVLKTIHTALTSPNRSYREIIERNNATASDHKLLFELRESSDITPEERDQLDELLDINYTKYIFK